MSPEPERNSYTQKSSQGEIKDFSKWRQGLSKKDRDSGKVYWKGMHTGEQEGLGKAGEKKIKKGKKKRRKKALNYERSRYINIYEGLWRQYVFFLQLCTYTHVYMVTLLMFSAKT